MHKLLVAAGAAAFLAASTIAGFAAEATGQISSIDPATGTVTLADGTVYEFTTPEDVANLQIGQEVTITYEEGGDGKLMATEAQPAS